MNGRRVGGRNGQSGHTSSAPLGRGKGRLGLGGLSLIFLTWTPLMGTLPVFAEPKEASLTITHSAKEELTVQGRFTAPISISIAWQVLTDYDGISRYVSSMKKSRVVKRIPPLVWVAQTAEAKVWIMSYPMSVSLRVTETLNVEIEFQDESGKDFTRYEGTWKLQEAPGGVQLDYRLVARPRIAIPSFMSEAIMRENAENLLGEVQAEMVRRGGTDRNGQAIVTPPAGAPEGKK